MKKLIGGTVATAAVYTALRTYGSGAPDPLTPPVALLAGVALTGFLATLVYPWRTWTLRRVGLFFMLGALDIFCVGSFWAAEVGMSMLTTARLMTLVLAMVIVGAPLGIAGVTTYYLGDRCEEREGDMTT